MPMESNRRSRPPEFLFFNKEATAEATDIYEGRNMNVVISVPYDGDWTKLAGKELPKKRPIAARSDVSLSQLGRDIYSSALESSDKAPTLIVQKVRPECLTSQLKRRYKTEVRDYLQKYSDTGDPTLLVVLESFKPRQDEEKYDIVLETAHRKTVQGTGLDIHFAEFMTNKGYSLYIPTEQRLPEEPYTAEDSNSPIQVVINNGDLLHVFALQMIISTDFLKDSPESIEKGQKLGSDIGEYLDQWKKGLEPRTLTRVSNIIVFPSFRR